MADVIDLGMIQRLLERMLTEMAELRPLKERQTLVESGLGQVTSSLGQVMVSTAALQERLDRQGERLGRIENELAELNTKVDLIRDGMDKSFAMLREILEHRR